MLPCCALLFSPAWVNTHSLILWRLTGLCDSLQTEVVLRSSSVHFFPVNVVLILFFFLCLDESRDGVGGGVCVFLAFRPTFSWAVLWCERLGHSAHESLISSMSVHFILPYGYIPAVCLRVHLCVFVLVCLCTPLMKLHPLLHYQLLFLLLLMLSHFLWVPDKPTKQGENRALYWDACQDSLWIYGRQTAFITQPRKAE